MENSFEDFKKYGDFFMTKNNYEEAIINYSPAIEIVSDNLYQVLFNRANCYIELNKFDLALIDIKKATELKLEIAMNWFLLGKCLKELNKNDEAIIAFDRAYQLEPTNKNYKKLSEGDIFGEINIKDEIEKVLMLNEEDKEDVIETKKEDVIKTKKEDVIETKKEDVIETKKEDVIETKKEDVIETKKEDVIETKKEEVIETKKEDVIETKKEEKEKEEDDESENENLNTLMEKLNKMNEQKKSNPMEGLMGDLFGKMMKNKKLVKLALDKDFQGKLNGYQANPMEAMKNPELMELVQDVLNEL